MNNNDDGSTFLSLIPQDNKSLKFYKQIVPVTIYHFYIVNEIEDVEPYLELINTLKTAEPHDSIFIYLNTPGGNLSTAVQLMTAIKQSQACVICSIEGSVCSAGTLIFLSGHKLIVNDNCTFMIHSYSQWGGGGKGHEIASQVRYQESYFRKLAEDIYGGFLSPIEITEMLQGKDIWLDSDQVKARLKLEAENTYVKSVPIEKKKSKRKVDQLPQ